MTRRLATVVIVNFNGAALLDDCLGALAAQTLPASQFQVWVVDNASTDASLRLLAERHPQVRVIRNTVNSGFAGGNNLALRQVETPYAVLLNTDTVADPGWLQALLAPLEADARVAVTTSKIVLLPRFVQLDFATPGFRPGGADPRELGVRVLHARIDGQDVLDRIAWERSSYGPERAGGARYYWTRPVGRALVPVPGDRDPARLELLWAAETVKPVRLGDATFTVQAEPTWACLEIPGGTPRVDVLNNTGGIVFADGFGADRGYQEVDRGQFDSPAEVFVPSGAAMAMRTSIARAAGFFDEDFFLYYEDTDLGWRLRSAGQEIRYVPTARVRHHHSATSQEFSPLWFFHVERNRLLMLTKNATGGLAAAQLARYLLTTASIALRAVRTRNRAGLRQSLGRGRVLASYTRLLPRMLAKRRALRRRAAVDRLTLQQRWLVPR